MSRILFYIVFCMMISSKTTKRSHKDTCENYFETTCTKSKMTENWFLQLTQKNMEVAAKLFSVPYGISKIEFDTQCKNLPPNTTFSTMMKGFLGKNTDVLNVEKQRVEESCVVRYLLKSDFIFKEMEKVEKAVDIATNGAVSENKDFVEFLRKNKAIAYVSATAFDKTRAFYKQCHLAVEKNEAEGDVKGLEKLSKDIKAKVNPLRALKKQNKVTFCGDPSSPKLTTNCEAFTNALIETHSYGAMAFFAFRSLEKMITKDNPNKNLPGLMQPHFVGKYSVERSGQWCDAFDDQLKFEDVDFDDQEDSSNLEKFSALSTILGRTHSEAHLKALVLFEKRLFKYSLPASELKKVKVLGTNSTIMTLIEIERELVSIVGWNKYFKELLERDYVEPKSEFLVICKGYFLALGELLKSTPKHVVLDYLEISTLFTVNKRFPRIFDEKTIKTLELTDNVDCSFLTEQVFPHTTGNMFSRHFKLKDQEKVVIGMIKNIKNSLYELINGLPWMKQSKKAELKKKLHKMKSVVGIPSEDWNTEFVNDYYQDVQLKLHFTQTLIELKRFNLKKTFQSLLENTEQNKLLRLNLPCDANAAYDFRDNEITINAGILRPPFLNNKSSELEVYSRLGFIIAHELMHSIGINGQKFKTNGELEIDTKDKTMVAFRSLVNHMKTKVSEICVVDVTENDGTIKSLNPDFELFKEEITADIGGVKVALAAYKRLLRKKGEEFDEKQVNRDYLKKLSPMFCEKLNDEDMIKSFTTNRHPPGFCRLNIISRLEEFAKARQCGKTKELEIW